MNSTNFNEMSHFDTFFGQSDVMTSFGSFGCQEPTYVSLDDYKLPAEALQYDDETSSMPSGLSKASKRIAKSPASEVHMPSARRSQKKSNGARNPWTPREDAQLLELMSKYGQSWAMIASCLPGRSGKQVRDRFLNKLRPGVRCGDWNNAEDELVVRLMKQVGNRWSFIATHLPGRTEVQVKNRFYSHIKKRIQPNGDFCQTLSLSSNSNSLASSDLCSSVASPSQDRVMFDFPEDLLDFPTETPIVLPEQTLAQTYMTKSSYIAPIEIPSELLPTSNTSVASQSPAEGARADPATEMISYEFPISDFCRQFSQPSLFKMPSFQFFSQDFTAPQNTQQQTVAHDVDFFLFHEQNERRSIDVEGERFAELSKKKALLERALAQVSQELNVSKI